MSEFSKINTDFLATTINADDKFYIVVLEDIDCVIGDRQDENDDLENKKNVNKLLQFLDSTSSPTNVVFVATTNHVDKLDDAIKRDGRFDLIVNIGNINKECAYKMCESFGIKDRTKIESILDGQMTDNKINPAKLQNLILQNIELDNKAVIGEEV
jgi:SpoVK/Ycf46/Vps4 family AAA+-type ATPase